KMSDTMEEGKIVTWRKQVGDPVAKGDALAEVETDKVNIEAEAFSAGTLRKILAPVGTVVAVGAPIALIGAPDEALPPEYAEAGATSAASTSAAVASAQPVAAGVAQGGNGVAPVAAPSFEPAFSSLEATQTAGGRVFISPIARRIAIEHGLDFARLHGTGPGGRIIREDVEAALEQQETGQHPAITITADGAVAVGAAPSVEVQAVPLSQMRKTIARRLQQSMQTAPHFYVTLAIDATRLGEFRTAVNEYASSLPQPVKVSFNDLIVKAVAQTLKLMPQVNVSFDGERLLFKKQINVGVAVALESGPNQGLIVPVVRDAEKRGVLDVARESRRLAEAAHAGTLKPDDIQGGTFTVSNLGMYGVESFTAIINPPESAILAVGAIIPTPVVVDRQVVVRDQMRVTLSVDHRALDGATAARFLQELKRLLEQPMAMLL
ncbi:MAG TPA: dihydrolipoamide acetyltransferase family protein, partial [Ktedonobacterales bacterium]|nr:dihydrolipoamide acetyltransferase family protein [Ktedonobacterales bacterium]